MEPEVSEHVGHGLLRQALFSSDEKHGPQETASTPEDKSGSHNIISETSLDSPQRSGTISLLRHLTYEVLGLLLAILSFVGLIIILNKYDDHPSPEWFLGSITVTLNAVISILSTIFSANLLMPVAQSIGQFCWVRYRSRPRPLRDICYYDDATRGLLGSAKLLFQLHPIQFASLGAIVTICAQALGPFFQQSVVYIPKLAIDHNMQSQSVAAYAWGPDVLKNQGELSSAFTGMPVDMKVAMHRGILTSNLASVPDPPFHCPTGNCTWDPFSTLAVGLKCTNLTSHVQLNCTQGQDATCNFKSPEDQELQKMLHGHGHDDSMVMKSTIPSELLPVLKPYANITGILAVVQWVKATGSLSQYLQIVPDTTFEASRCILYVSVQELDVKVKNGIYSQEVLQEYVYSENTKHFYHFNGTDYDFLDAFQGLSDVDLDLVYKPPFARTPSNHNDTFVMPYQAWLMLTSQFAQPGFLTGSINRQSTFDLAGPAIPSLLYQSPNVTRGLSSLADYMTTTMRANGSSVHHTEQENRYSVAPNQAVAGLVWMDRQFVHVRWAWLALPAMLLVLAAVAFVAAILETRRARVGLWVSNPLTLFFHARMNGDLATTDLKVGALDTDGGMQDVAAGLRARISPGANRVIEVDLDKE